MAYRWLSNWLLAGTCWAEIALRSAWMAAWLMLGLKTQTSEPELAHQEGKQTSSEQPGTRTYAEN